MRWTSKATLTGLLLVAIPLLALALLDFRVSQSSDTLHTEIARFTAGVEAGTQLIPPDSLRIRIEGDDSTAVSLEKELAQQWAAMSGPRNPDLMTGPALLVQPERHRAIWTPLYASASVTIRIAYSSDGDLSWRDDGSVAMVVRDGKPQIRVRGDLKLEETTRGLVSRPAYERHLAQRIAVQVSDTLWKQLSGRL